MLTKGAKAIAIVVCLLVCAQPSAILLAQGPGGEILRKGPPPPPVNEAAAARAEKAVRARRQVSVGDQVELALKQGNAAIDKYFKCVLANCGHELGEAERLAHLADAEANYQHAGKLNPKDWRAPAGLGRVYSYERRLKNAAYAYQKAADLKPNDPLLYFYLGLVYATDGKNSEATQAWARSCALDSSAKNYEGCSALANSYWADKRTCARS